MNINLTAPINSLGYGIVSLNILAGLSRLGHTPALWVLGYRDVPGTHSILVDEAAARMASYDRDAPSLRIWHQFDLAQHVGKGIHAAFPIFELDRFRPVERHHMAQQDVVFVATEWAGQVCRDNGLANWRVVPFGIDQDIFFPRDLREPRDETIFMNVGKWELRKGHDVIIDAFCKAFNKDDKVRLVMLCNNPCFSDMDRLRRYNKQWEDLYFRSPLGAKIEIIPTRLENQRAVADLMAQADCGVFPARAEGWNLDLAEMLAIGRPCIATNATGHTQYVTKENCLLIEPGPMEKAYDGVWFTGQGEWPSFGADQVEQLVQHMRAIHKQKQECGSLYNKAGADTMREFTWDATASKIAEYLCR